MPGADAAPYFRVFNPAPQSAKFDEDPGLHSQVDSRVSNLPNEMAACPVAAPDHILLQRRVTLKAITPIVSIAWAANLGMQAFERIKRFVMQVESMPCKKLTSL